MSHDSQTSKIIIIEIIASGALSHLADEIVEQVLSVSSITRLNEMKPLLLQTSQRTAKFERP